MDAFICDQCKRTVAGKPVIELRGVGRKSGILLPHHVQKHDFCMTDCFWKFVEEQKPEI